MTDDEQICLVAKTEDDKPLFCLGMIRVVDYQGFIVIKYRCLLYTSDAADDV